MIHIHGNPHDDLSGWLYVGNDHLVIFRDDERLCIWRHPVRYFKFVIQFKWLARSKYPECNFSIDTYYYRKRTRPANRSKTLSELQGQKAAQLPSFFTLLFVVSGMDLSFRIQVT